MTGRMCNTQVKDLLLNAETASTTYWQNYETEKYFMFIIFCNTTIANKLLQL